MSRVVIRRKPRWRISVGVGLRSGETYNAAVIRRANTMADLLDDRDTQMEDVFEALPDGVEKRLEGILEDHPEEVTRLSFTIEKVETA